MIFKIRDGREYFYQWDIDREILVLDPTVTEVHFCNRTDDCSLVVEVKEIEIFADNKLLRVERYAQVPNILLQDNWKIKAYAYCSDTFTKVEQTFNVKSRTKPSDYVYTETEVLTYQQLEKRLDEIEENGFSEDVVNNAVNDYFEKNPIEIPEPDLTGYATEDYVDNAVANVKVDLTGYATEEYVQKEIAEAALGGEVDLDGYATEQYVQTEIGKIKIPTVPTNVSAFTNDAKYATENYVTQAINNIDIPEADVDLGDYYTKAEVYNKTEVDNKLSDISVDTEVQISDDGNGNVTIEAAEGGGEVTPADLSNYYTKDETNALIPYVPSKVSELANDKNYISSIPSEYITETELNAKGYVTSLAGYATTDYVEDMLDGANKALSYAHYSEMMTKLVALDKDALSVGQNIMIVELNVPDLWVSGIETTSTTPSYATDVAIINELAQTGYIRVGYFRLSALETQKVDLTSYADRAEVNQLISTATDALVYNSVNESTTLTLSITELPPISTITHSNAITAINQLQTTLVEGFSVQFKTATEVTNNETTAYWIGDDCKDGVFTPIADTFYEVYCYYNSVKANVVNMVIKL